MLLYLGVTVLSCLMSSTLRAGGSWALSGFWLFRALGMVEGSLASVRPSWLQMGPLISVWLLPPANNFLLQTLSS